MVPLIFPEFNIYSTTLLVLVLQGYIFAILLLTRYFQQRRTRDLFLAAFLFITGYHRTTYIIGFMGWYDTYRATKINYTLINLSLAIGPLIYFYVKSAINPRFTFRRKDLWHFIPVAIYAVIMLFVFAYDATQPGFGLKQNGVLMEGFVFKHLSTIHGFLTIVSMLLYLVFAIQSYLKYTQQLTTFYSNTHRVALRWLRNFLGVFSFIFVFGLVQDYIDFNVFTLHWTQSWWIHFVSACAMVYLGTYGYFTDINGLQSIDPTYSTLHSVRQQPAHHTDRTIQPIIAHMKNARPYLNPELTIAELADQVDMPTVELSSLINGTLGKNFNDFVNEFRVDYFKSRIDAGDADRFSLLGIALESGFNSKATFNRTFKKFTGSSPSAYLKSMD